MASITGDDVLDMVNHWLSVPQNGYLGSGYGQNVGSTLLKPFAAGKADGVIAKLRADVPILQSLPQSEVQLYAQKDPQKVDVQNIFIAVSGNTLQVPTGGAGAN